MTPIEREISVPRRMINISVVPSCFQTPDPYPFEDFAPTLAQCYLIVIFGYLSAKFQLVSASEARAINAFVLLLGMPAIVCVSLATAPLAALRWELLAALFAGKALVFALVAVGARALGAHLGVAALLALFCVHSNDLPVGNPLMSALYKTHRPHMLMYLFLMPAMTMVFFVPLGHFLLAVHQRSASALHGGEKWWQRIGRQEALVAFRNIAKSSPLLLATAMGIILNFCFSTNLPPPIHKPLQVLAATVPGCVLSILGFNMVRKERYLITSAVVTATVLLFVKILVTPLLLHALSSWLSDTKELSDFALLYGIVSPATAVFLAGPEFRKPLAAMSAALITTSFLSFPISYVIARFSLVAPCKLSHYVPLLRSMLFWVACFSIVCDIIVLISIVWKKKWHKVPYCYVMCLVFTQMLTCSGVLVWHLSDEEAWSVYCQMALYYGGEISGFIWLATIAVILLSARRYPGLAQNAFAIIASTTFTTCGVITAAMWALISYNDIKKVYIVGRARSNFEFLQLAAGTTLQVICTLVVGVCLLLHFKKQPLTEALNKESKMNIEYDNPIFYTDAEHVTATHYKRKRFSCASVLSVQNAKEEADLYYREVVREGERSSAPEWTFRFFSLLLLLFLVTLVKLISNVYKLAHSMALEVMIPLEFLQSTLFIGQGFFILLTFGIDARTISIRMTNWWRRCRFGKEEFIQTINPDKISEDSEEALFCQQFYTFYFNKCFQNLAKDRKWKDSLYKDCFWGHQLIDWLIQEGVAKDDVEAEEQGQKLLVGGAIAHVTGSHHFHDAPYLYFFIKRHQW